MTGLHASHSDSAWLAATRVASLGEMADRVMYYLNHREEWCSIAANMRRLMEGELTLEQSLAQILGQAETASRRG